MNIAEKYTIGRYGDKRHAQQAAALHGITYEQSIDRTYAAKPKYTYAHFQMCPCGTPTKTKGGFAVCQRKACLRHRKPLPVKTARIMFIEGDEETIEADIPAGNKAIFNRDGLVRVLRRDCKKL